MKKPYYNDGQTFMWLLPEHECNITAKNGQISGMWIRWSYGICRWLAEPMTQAEVMEVYNRLQLA
jgi:hypothetical protein